MLDAGCRAHRAGGGCACSSTNQLGWCTAGWVSGVHSSGFAPTHVADKAEGAVLAVTGTSPLYVFPNTFAAQPSEQQVLGAMSLIFWTLTIIVVFKYVCLVLHANDRGEGVPIPMAAMPFTYIGCLRQGTRAV